MNQMRFLNFSPETDESSGTNSAIERIAHPSFARINPHSAAELRIVVTIQEEIALRPIAPEDEHAMVWFHSQLSDESIYLRYFDHASLASRTQPERLRQVCTNTPESFAIIAEKKAHRAADPEIFAVGRLTLVVPSSFGVAEFAILLRDEDALGTALARLVLERLIILAREFGFSQLTSELLTADVATIDLCRSLGFDVSTNVSTGCVRVRLGL